MWWGTPPSTWLQTWPWRGLWLVTILKLKSGLLPLPALPAVKWQLFWARSVLVCCWVEMFMYRHNSHILYRAPLFQTDWEYRLWLTIVSSCRLGPAVHSFKKASSHQPPVYPGLFIIFSVRYIFHISYILYTLSYTLKGNLTLVCENVHIRRWGGVTWLAVAGLQGEQRRPPDSHRLQSHQ